MKKYIVVSYHRIEDSYEDLERAKRHAEMLKDVDGRKEIEIISREMIDTKIDTN